MKIYKKINKIAGEFCYFIMDTLGVYLAENETPEAFLTKYLTKAKKRAGWKDINRKSTKYSTTICSLEEINEYGVEIEKEAEIEMY